MAHEVADSDGLGAQESPRYYALGGFLVGSVDRV